MVSNRHSMQPADLKTDTPILYLICIFAFFTMCCVLFISPRLRYDSLVYISTARSICLNQDLNVYDEDTYYTTAGWEDVTQRKKLGSPDKLLKYFNRPDYTEMGYRFPLFPIGNTIFWLSPYAALSGLCALDIVTFQPCSGYSWPWIGSLTLWGILWFLIGIVICFFTLNQFFRLDLTTISIIAILGFGNSLPFVLIDPCFSHSLDFLLHAGCLAITVQMHKKPSVMSGFLWGVLIGFSIIVRYQNVFLLVFPFLYLIHVMWQKLRDKNTQQINQFVAFLLGFLMFLSVQVLYWKIISGSFWITPAQFGASNLPSLNPLNPQLIPMLFSRFHGFFSWMPGMMIAGIGVLCFFKKDRWIAAGILITIILHTYYNSSRSEWWNLGFGVRRFVGPSIYFMIGLASILEYCKPKLLIRIVSLLTVTILVIWNLLFIGLFYQDSGMSDRGLLQQLIQSTRASARFDYGWIGPRIDKTTVLFSGFCQWIQKDALVPRSLLNPNTMPEHAKEMAILISTGLVLILILTIWGSYRWLRCLNRDTRIVTILSQSAVILWVLTVAILIHFDIRSDSRMVARLPATGNMLQLIPLKLAPSSIFWGENVWKSLGSNMNEFSLSKPTECRQLSVLWHQTAYAQSVMEQVPFNAVIQGSAQSEMSLEVRSITRIDEAQVQRNIGPIQHDGEFYQTDLVFDSIMSHFSLDRIKFSENAFTNQAGELHIVSISIR